MKTRHPLALLAAVAAVGCGASSLAGPDERAVVQPIEVQSVEVFASGSPGLVTARITGTLGSGCDHLHSIENARQGNAVTIEIKRRRVTEAVCTTEFKEFREDLGVAGEFEPGEYTLRVNQVTRPFSVR